MASVLPDASSADTQADTQQDLAQSDAPAAAFRQLKRGLAEGYFLSPTRAGLRVRRRGTGVPAELPRRHAPRPLRRLGPLAPIFVRLLLLLR